MPLAEILDVTVTELLECRRGEKGTLQAEEAEALVQKALYFREEPSIRPDWRKNGLILGCTAVIAALEISVLLGCGYPIKDAKNSLFLFFILTAVCGGYFWLFIRERLPRYYDENRITTYSDGFFRMNLVGIAFNNRNWPYIVRIGRIWTVISLLVTPVFFGAVYFLFPMYLGRSVKYVAMLLTLVGLFLPMFIAAKKYE